MGCESNCDYSGLICQVLDSIKVLLSFLCPLAQGVSQNLDSRKKNYQKLYYKAEGFYRKALRLSQKQSPSLSMLLEIKRKVQALSQQTGLHFPTTSTINSYQQSSSGTQAEINSFFSRLESSQVAVIDQKCIQCCEKMDKNRPIFFKNYKTIPHVGITSKDFLQDQIVFKNSCAILNALGGYLIVGVNIYKTSQPQGFSFNQQNNERIKKMIEKMKKRIMPEFKVEHRLIQIKSDYKQEDRKYMLVIKLKPLRPRQIYYIVASKAAYEVDVKVSILSGEPQRLVAQKVPKKQIYPKMLEKLKENRQSNFEFEHEHTIHSTLCPPTNPDQPHPKILPQQKVKPPFQKSFKKSKQFLNLLVVGNSKKIQIIQKFKSQLIAQKRVFELHQPFKQYISQEGDNGRSFWVYQHDEKLPLIRQILKKYDRGGNITLLVASKQIEFSVSDLDPFKAQSFFQALLQLYPQQHNFRQFFFTHLSKKQPSISIVFRSIEASAFALTWLQSSNIRACFIKTLTKNAFKHF